MLKTNPESNPAITGNELKPDRPNPIVANIDVVPYKKRMPPQDAIDALIEGHHVLVVDFYSSGLTILNELKRYIKYSFPDQSFQGQRDMRSAFYKLSQRLLLKISNHKLVVRKAPEIGWIKILYPELAEFLLPFPQVQGLNSSWQWYQNGITIPVLNKKIHPWYGSYFPTRFEHIELFNKWLKEYYKGEKQSAFDIGIGSGILSLIMLKNGFGKIHGTDSNPNTIVGLHEHLGRHNQKSKIELYYGDLFANCNLSTELIVFNPPWLPASYNVEGLDKAIYYDETLFPRFFEEASKHLSPNGKLVILFSNLSQITNSASVHPIAEELNNAGRFKKEAFIQKDVGTASKKTKREQTWRASEKVELWVLSLI